MRTLLRCATSMVVAVAVIASACGSGDARQRAAPARESSITVYSGRSRELVGPVIERFEAATGIRAEVRYGDTAELAATILDEGDRSPADVFFAQDAGALGAVDMDGRLADLDPGTLERVPPVFRSPRGTWVGISGRVRTAVYNPSRVPSSDLPGSILGFTDSTWKDRLGWAPANGSFQAFVTALRVLKGDDVARAWLEGIKANGAVAYPNNVSIVQAVAAGEIDVGFVNHYYALELAKQDPGLAATNHFFTGGDPGGLVNVAAVGILKSSKSSAEARRFVEYLLSEEAQHHFATMTLEYPLIESVKRDPVLPALGELQPPSIDLSDLADLRGTLELLSEAGVL